MKQINFQKFCQNHWTLIYMYVYMLAFQYVYIYIYVRNTELMENGSFRLFAANGNGKRKFDFHGRKTINGNRWVVFQQQWPSMPLSRDKVRTHLPTVEKTPTFLIWYALAPLQWYTVHIHSSSYTHMPRYSETNTSPSSGTHTTPYIETGTPRCTDMHKPARDHVDRWAENKRMFDSPTGFLF